MRVSRLMLVTLRDAPADAEIISHKLLIRGGYIKRVTSGIYAYMPLMWKVIKKITSIVQEELNNKGCLETLLPQLHPASLWKESGRWQGYTAGEGIMFNLKDRQGRELGLGPTHEEVITKIAGDILQSYKQLPVNLYQIQTKFRDEIRPRFGLMRSREFIMKDAYSFHCSEKNLKDTYNDMYEAYTRIFSRCGLKTVAVDADSGAIGGAASQEFMVTANAGEDSILISSDSKYAANQEKAISLPSNPIILHKEEPSIIETKNQSSIDELCKNQSLDASQVVKVILLLAILEGNKELPVLISIRGDQELNEVKLTNCLSKSLKRNIIQIRRISKEDFDYQGIKDIPLGYIGPDLKDSILKTALSWEKTFIRYIDNTAASLECFICGANKLDHHRIFYNWNLLKCKADIVDIRNAKAGDRCLHDKSQILEEIRGIEVGHIFQLGRKYSQSLNTSFTNESGEQESFWMGCYGIGISRLAQATVEQSFDKSGIIWPIAIAPFEVIIVVANMQDEIQKKLGNDLYLKLKNKNIDVLLDDRKERAGLKFKDADLIGIPWRIVVGRDSVSGKVELVKRLDGSAELFDTDQVIDKLLTEICSEKSLLMHQSL